MFGICVFIFLPEHPVHFLLKSDWFQKENKNLSAWHENLNAAFSCFFLEKSSNMYENIDFTTTRGSELSQDSGEETVQTPDSSTHLDVGLSLQNEGKYKTTKTMS